MILLAMGAPMDALVRRRREEHMIVGRNKGLFFTVTALMCSASLYAAESTASRTDPLARIFTGEPNRLTLPPDFPGAALVSIEGDEACGPQVVDDGASAVAALHNATRRSCAGDAWRDSGARVLPETASAVATGAQANAEPISVGGTVQSH